MVAEVIVDISNSEVDRIFDYEIDSSLSLRAGFRVLVPFGRMTVEGYITSLSYEEPRPAGGWFSRLIR